MRYKIIIFKSYSISHKHYLKNEDIDYWDTVDKKRIKHHEDPLYCSAQNDKFFDNQIIQNFNVRYFTTFEDIW